MFVNYVVVRENCRPGIQAHYILDILVYNILHQVHYGRIRRFFMDEKNVFMKTKFAIINK